MLVRTRSTPRQGAAAVEFAIVLTILFPLLLGVWEIGRLINVQQLVSNAAREGGRHASTGLQNSAEVRTVVLNYLQNAGLSKITAVAADAADLQKGGKVLVEFEVYDAAGVLKPGMDVKAAGQNYKIQVKVRLVFNDVEYSPTNYFLGTDYQVSATVAWYCMKDIPIVINDVIPLY